MYDVSHILIVKQYNVKYFDLISIAQSSWFSQLKWEVI